MTNQHQPMIIVNPYQSSMIHQRGWRFCMNLFTTQLISAHLLQLGATLVEQLLFAINDST